MHRIADEDGKTIGKIDRPTWQQSPCRHAGRMDRWNENDLQARNDRLA